MCMINMPKTTRKNANQGRRKFLLQVLMPWLARLKMMDHISVSRFGNIYLLTSADMEAKTPKSPPNMIILSLWSSWLVRAMVIRAMPEIR